MITVSLFSGCGGLDYGFEAAGCEVVFRNDFDKHSCETLRLNGAPYVAHAAIEDISAAAVKSVVGSSRHAVDLIVGGPPCQPFSKAGYWARGDTLRLADPRANTLNEYFRLVEELRPLAFVLENVHGIGYSGKEEGFRYLIDRVREVNRKRGTNYRPVWRVVDAADYGVPQRRVRFFLVAIRDGREFRFPEPTHRSREADARSLFELNLPTHLTAWDAIGDLELDEGELPDLVPSGQWAELLPSIPEGENYLWHTDRRGGQPLFGWRTRYWSFLLKLSKRLPSWTIPAQPGPAIGPFHWHSRRLSRRELAALQTFPKSFMIASSRIETQRQIGNAVPSLLAEVIAANLVAQLKNQKVSQERKLALREAKAVPAPERTSDVPTRYLHLVGKHAAHPGTGKGRAYANANLVALDDSLI